MIHVFTHSGTDELQCAKRLEESNLLNLTFDFQNYAYYVECYQKPTPKP